VSHKISKKRRRPLQRTFGNILWGRHVTWARPSYVNHYFFSFLWLV
jgi:hypothetical protein